MEMGTNDGPGNAQQITSSTNGRPELAGLGDETTEGPDSSAAHKMETVHTFGWYMTKYVKETKEKGATPVMLTMIPHNTALDRRPGEGKSRCRDNSCYRAGNRNRPRRAAHAPPC